MATEDGGTEIESAAEVLRDAPDGDRARVLLLTGRPGVGKTTALRRVAARLEDLEVRGFYTEEMRDESGERVGFHGRPLGGEGADGEDGSGVIASVEAEGEPRVGEYGVDVDAVDRLSERHLSPEGADVVVVDEIGKMECFSDVFVSRVRQLLDGETAAVASVSRSGDGLIREVKASDRTELWEIDRENRDRMPGRIAAWVRERAGS